ncbi:juvenile hormone esterase-like [Haematobia irritans]|uniref:juvenile hormone esterase-like n=1 Tax=Haematobia irritans TaxID=7368 RepID=UPI003F4FD65B
MSLTSTVFGILLITFCHGKETTVNVDTSLGTIKGIQVETRFNNKFWSFRGIRYAEAPVGELRFQSPQAVRSWKPKVYDATQDGPLCPQEIENRSWISEDCLRLNIYTKSLGNETKHLNPVIVYIHPGGFYAGSGMNRFFGPDYFMERDIVLVTLNYRLATLGFLATGTQEATGNMGLKDQVMALRWIQTHIEKFGGDSKSVTLWGYSAGSFSIGLHMISPMSKGLFHRAIMQSASPLAQFRYDSNQKQLAEKQAKLLKCPLSPIQDMVKCLQGKPMMDFVNTTADMFYSNWNPVYNWLPVVEPDFGQERFLVEDPYKTMINGNFYKVPIIMGVTQYEFYYLAHYTLRDENTRPLFSLEFEKNTPLYFLYEADSPKSQNISKALYSFYFKNSSIEYPQSTMAFGELYSDGLIIFAYHRFLKMVSKHTPVYTYLFTYKGRYSHFKNPDTNQTLGAMHHDELLYLFYVPLMTPMFTKTDQENNTIERLTRMWYEFAKKSNPENSSDEYISSLKWPLYDDKNKQYLEIGRGLNVKMGDIYPERMQLWDRTFPVSDVINCQ